MCIRDSFNVAFDVLNEIQKIHPLSVGIQVNAGAGAQQVVFILEQGVQGNAIGVQHAGITNILFKEMCIRDRRWLH